MKPHKFPSSQILLHNKLKSATVILSNQRDSVALFSSTPCSNTNHTQTETPYQSFSTDSPPVSTHQALLNSIQSSQWHFVKHLAPNLTPDLISSALLSLQKTPDLALQFVTHTGFKNLDIRTKCLALAVISRSPSPKPTLQLLKETLASGISTIKEVFDELAVARERLNAKSIILFDLLIRACCELKKGDDAFECFSMMKEKGVVPKIETCNAMLSLFLKLNRTQTAWVLYAEMFRLRINSTVYTFNIMINVLCKEGKLKKAKEFIGFMESLGVKPNVVTYNTIIHGYCWLGRVEGAQTILDAMKSKGLHI